MPSPLSINFTEERAKPFDGASPMSCTTPSTLSVWMKIFPGNETVGNFGQTIGDLSEPAVLRIFSCYVIGHLNNSSLKEASEWLLDLYKWQRDQDKRELMINHEVAPKLISISGYSKIESEPFTFEG